jgi:peptidase A4-like protein
MTTSTTRTPRGPAVQKKQWTAARAAKRLAGHQLPPPGFDFAAGSEGDRAEYGFPAEPDRTTQPKLWAKWERNLHRPWRRVMPTYDLQPARAVRRGSPAANNTFSNWSGAAATPPSGKGFATVSATWTVPDAYPPSSAWNGTGYNAGFWNTLHWVGIGGDIGAGHSNLLQAGTGTDVKVSVPNGSITVTPYVWFEWWNSALDNGYSRLNGFKVSTGDLVEVSVCTPTDINGAFTIGNVTTNQYVTQAIYPPSSGLTLIGNTAEWIVEREGFTSGEYSALANYGAVFFSDCQAGGSGFEANLSGAGLINMTDGSSIVSTAVEVSPTVLECYYGTSQP